MGHNYACARATGRDEMNAIKRGIPRMGTTVVWLVRYNAELYGGGS
jgi:hypothetical protein